MNKYIVDEKKRKELGEYLKKIREKKGLGLNQLALKIETTSSLISKLENGLTQKISPFLLQEISEGLKIDYKELYKIVGYLDDNDFNENLYIEKIKILENELKECKEKLNIQNNSNNGHIIVGSSNNIKNSYAGTELCNEMRELTEIQREKVLKFINEYIK